MTETDWQGWTGGEWNSWSRNPQQHAKAGSQEEAAEEKKKKEEDNKAASSWEWGEEEKKSAWKEEAAWGKWDWNHREEQDKKRSASDQQDKQEKHKYRSDGKSWKWDRPSPQFWINRNLDGCRLPHHEEDFQEAKEPDERNWNQQEEDQKAEREEETQKEEQGNDDKKKHKFNRRDSRLWVRIFLHKRHDEFDLVPKAIGRNGKHMKKINQATEAKSRIRGRGSGHLEAMGENGKAKEAPVHLMLAITTNKTTPQKFLEAVSLAVDLLKEMDQHYIQFCIQRGMQLPRADEHCFSFGEVSRAAEKLLQDYAVQYPPPPIFKQATPGGVMVTSRQPPDAEASSSSSSHEAAPRASSAPAVREARLVMPPSHAARQCCSHYEVGDQLPVWPELGQQIWAEQMMAAQAYHWQHWQQMRDIRWEPSWHTSSWFGWGSRASQEQQGNCPPVPDHHQHQDQRYWNVPWPHHHYPWGQWEPSGAEASVEEMPEAMTEASRSSIIWGPATEAAQIQTPANAGGQQDENLGQIIESAVNDFIKGKEENSHVEREDGRNNTMTSYYSI